MGADDKSVYTKCGEILVHIKSKNWKTKIYQYNCAYCNVTCKQLNKFSKHIESKHFRESTQQSKDKPEIYEAEINEEFFDELKAKPEIYEEVINPQCSELSKDEPVMGEMLTNPEFDEKPENKQEIYVPQVKLEVFGEDLKTDDPLGSRVTVMLPTVGSNDELMEEDENYNDDKVEDYTMNDWQASNDDDNENTESEGGKERLERNKKRKLRGAKSRKKQKVQTDNEEGVTSDDSQDADFDFEKTLLQTNRDRCKPKKKQPQKTHGQQECPISESEIVIDEKVLSIALLEAFEKRPILWDVDKRIFNKDLIQKDYELITNEVNEKLKYNIKWMESRKRIREMRYEYSLQLEKQRKGLEHEIPWYVEHMKYLEANIDVLLKGRYEISKYRPLKTMDEAELKTLIELYKKNEILWQVNNMWFGICQKKTEILEEIREELNRIHNITVTPEHFHRRLNYFYRIYSKDRKREIKCDLEKQEFIPLSPFYKELAFLSDSLGPFKCSTCNEIIEKYENYHVHVAKHNNVLPFKCQHCEGGCKTFSGYLQHMRRHLQLNNFHCDVCGKGYPSKPELDYHVTLHTGGKPFLCQICGERFRGRIQYDIHVRKHDKRYRFICEICNQGFYLSTLYKAHVNLHLNIRDFVCNICGKAYTVKKNLTRHLLTHEDKKDFACNVCDKKFTQKSTLQTHQKIHEMYTL